MEFITVGLCDEIELGISRVVDQTFVVDPVVDARNARENGWLDKFDIFYQFGRISAIKHNRSPSTNNSQHRSSFVNMGERQITEIAIAWFLFRLRNV